MSGAGWVWALITVPADLVDVANAVAASLDFDEGGALTFDAPLAAAGQDEPTDFGASTKMRPHTLEIVAGTLLGQFPGARLYHELGGWTLSAALEDAGLRILTGRDS